MPAGEKPTPTSRRRYSNTEHSTPAQDVRHPLFQNSEFFDPSDLLQVKYEMLRQAHAEKRAVFSTAKEFGFSRPSFYQAEFAFEQDGLPGLLPQKRGPRNGHKLTPEVMKFVTEQQTLEPSLSLAQLAEQVAAPLPRESAPPQHRAAASAGKKTPMSLLPAHTAAPLEKDGLIAAYEELRSQILNGQRGPGLALFMRRGMREWMNACSLCLAPVSN